jgi:hypothetical protein
MNLITSAVVPKERQPSGPQMEWTGERYVTSVGGEIEFEHTHRYLFAMQFAEGAMVLDVASGEGTAVLSTRVVCSGPFWRAERPNRYMA